MEPQMDAFFIVLTVAFFGLCFAYARGFERL